MAASHAPPTGDLARNPGMCPHCKVKVESGGVSMVTHHSEQRANSAAVRMVTSVYFLLSPRE